LAPPPPQRAGGSLLLRAGPPANVVSVLSASGCCLGTLPVASRVAPTTTFRLSVPALAFSCSVQEPQTRHHLYAGHRLASTRAPSKLVPGVVLPPGFDAILSLTTPQQRRLFTRRSGTSSWSPPDASSAPFPCRSPRRSSANAAQGGLTPAPVGRRRKAICLPSLAQHHDRKVPT
jgi:hypothetical protein